MTVKVVFTADYRTSSEWGSYGQSSDSGPVTQRPSHTPLNRVADLCRILSRCFPLNGFDRFQMSFSEPNLINQRMNKIRYFHLSLFCRRELLNTYNIPAYIMPPTAERKNNCLLSAVQQRESCQKFMHALLCLILGSDCNYHWINLKKIMKLTVISFINWVILIHMRRWRNSWQ